MYTDGNMESGGSTGRSLMIFILGAAVGATCALLYAPATGEELRGQIADKAGQLKDKAVEFKDRAIDKADEWKNKAAEVAADTMDRTSQTIRKTAQTTRDEAGVGLQTQPV